MASEAGTEFGSASKSRRLSKASSARMDQCFASGLQNVQRQTRENDVDFIKKEVDQLPDGTVGTMAALFRSGALVRGLTLSKMQLEQDDSKGDLILPKIRHFKGLNESHYDNFLQRFEAQIFSASVLERLIKSEKKDLVHFALNLSVQCVLPDHQDYSHLVHLLCQNTTSQQRYTVHVRTFCATRVL
jgi:hypothetical protein